MNNIQQMNTTNNPQINNINNIKINNYYKNAIMKLLTNKIKNNNNRIKVPNS